MFSLPCSIVAKKMFFVVVVFLLEKGVLPGFLCSSYQTFLYNYDDLLLYFANKFFLFPYWYQSRCRVIHKTKENSNKVLVADWTLITFRVYTLLQNPLV